MLTRRLFVAAAAAAMAFTTPALAEFPEKPIQIIVSYKPGGTSDTLTRAILPYLEEELGTEVVIVNTAGGGGAVGWTKLKNARPDGYTIGHYSNAMAVLEAIKSARFTPEDFTPIAKMGDVYLTVTARGDTEFEDISDYAEAAKESPGDVALAMGRGTLSQFVAAQVEEGIGADLQLVNAGGGADKKAALLGGHVEAIIEPTPGVFPQHEAGEFRILAILAPERLEFAPDVPTATEHGFDVVAALVSGLIGPAGLPEDRVRTIADAVKRASDNPEYLERSRQLRQVVDPQGPEAFAEVITEERERALATGASLGF